MSTEKDIAGPIVVWTDYGTEGWQPQSYESIAEAIELGGLNSRLHAVTIVLKPKDYVREPNRSGLLVDLAPVKQERKA